MQRSHINGTPYFSNTTFLKAALSFILFFALLPMVGCSSAKKPVLYPNHHYNMVGDQQAQMDINTCMQMAQSSGANDGKGSELAKDTAKAGAVGAATGAVVGSIASGSDVGRGAAIGGAGAATARLVSGAFDASDPTPIYMRFVDQCLRDKGYQTIGWR